MSALATASEGIVSQSLPWFDYTPERRLMREARRRRALSYGMGFWCDNLPQSAEANRTTHSPLCSRTGTLRIARTSSDQDKPMAWKWKEYIVLMRKVNDADWIDASRHWYLQCPKLIKAINTWLTGNITYNLRNFKLRGSLPKTRHAQTFIRLGHNHFFSTDVTAARSILHFPHNELLMNWNPAVNFLIICYGKKQILSFINSLNNFCSHRWLSWSCVSIANFLKSTGKVDSINRKRDSKLQSVKRDRYMFFWYFILENSAWHICVLPKKTRMFLAISRRLRYGTADFHYISAFVKFVL